MCIWRSSWKDKGTQELKKIRQGNVEPNEKKLLISHLEWPKSQKKQSVDHRHFTQKMNHNNNQVQHGWGRGCCGRYMNYANCRGHGRCNNEHSDEETHGKNDNQDKNKIECYYFQEFGHYATECKNPR